MYSEGIYLKVKEIVDEIHIVDSHEHLASEKDRVNNVELPFSVLKDTLYGNLSYSGMTADQLRNIMNESVPVSKRWHVISPFWQRVKHTSFGEACKIWARDLYGVNKIDEDGVKQLEIAMKERNCKGLYHWVLKEKGRVDIALPMVFEGRLKTIDKDIFAPVLATDSLLSIKSPNDLALIESIIKKPVHRLEDLIESMHVRIEKAVRNGIVALKLGGVSRERGLKFRKVSRSEASEIFNRIPYPFDMFKSREHFKTSEANILQDFLFHELLGITGEYGIPWQIHAGNIWLEDSNPADLLPVLAEYKELVFDIFHAAFPYVGQLTTIARRLKNVYVDLCWIHSLSGDIAEHILGEWLDMLPNHKIIAFGGDYFQIEGAYAHSVQARENVARVLSQRVEKKRLSLEDAGMLARRLLRDNAIDLFRLKEKGYIK